MPDDPCPDCSAKDDEIAILESSLDEANATIADFKRDLAAAALLDASYIAEKIKPVNLTKYPLNLRYQAWGDLARQIRGELAAGGQ